ncbi:MAG: hypothetical protein J5J00_02195 [Deltaproteobacteria bacterium]|nr:hypothetical protein [Deltaproteobacteria bacterium]
MTDPTVHPGAAKLQRALQEVVEQGGVASISKVQHVERPLAAGRNAGLPDLEQVGHFLRPEIPEYRLEAHGIELDSALRVAKLLLETGGANKGHLTFNRATSPISPESTLLEVARDLAARTEIIADPDQFDRLVPRPRPQPEFSAWTNPMVEDRVRLSVALAKVLGEDFPVNTKTAGFEFHTSQKDRLDEHLERSYKFVSTGLAGII